MATTVNNYGGGAAITPQSYAQNTQPGQQNTTSAYPQNAMNLGGPVYPWLQPYGGNFAAPMSPWETQALGGYGNFVGGGAGTGPAMGYYNTELTGKFLDPSTNPWLKQIQTSGQSIKDYQDQQALARINSAMAAGGNTLSGANAAAMGNYLNQSGANFENIMGNLMNQNYQFERGLQNQGAVGSLGAANQYGNSLQNLMAMGSVPRNIQNQDLQGQYQDFLRQIQGYQQAFNYPNQLAYEELHSGYPGSAQPNYGTSQATGIAALLSSLLGGGAGGGGALNNLLTGGGGGGGGLMGLLNSLFGGGGTTGGGGTPDQNANLALYNLLNSGGTTPDLTGGNPTDYSNMDLYNLLNSGGYDTGGGYNPSGYSDQMLYNLLQGGG